jgi:ATP-dependent exoDNAse (exonuclease V) alpha subunit
MIFHCSAKAISRAAGRSATAAAAYRSGERIIDERTGEVHDYRRRRGILHKELVFPEVAQPLSRSSLWNMAEAAEKRKDAKVAREWELALPAEMRPSERAALARDFAKALAERYGVAVDICIHAPGKKGDDRNHHAHLLTTTRSFAGDRFGEKTRIFDSPKTSGQEVDAVRQIWERLCNAALALVGVKERVDRRTLKAQGIQRESTRHLGPTASAMERRGVRTFRGDINRRVNSISVTANIEKELAELKKLGGGIAVAKERFAARKAEKERQERERMERIKRGRELLERQEREATRRREAEAAKNRPTPSRGMER